MLTPEGRVAVASTHSPTVYLLPGSGQTDPTIRIDHRIFPQGFARGEREELLAALEYARRNAPPFAQRQYQYSIPEQKSVYSSVWVTPTGSLWLGRPAPGHRVPPVPAFRSGSPEPPPMLSFREQRWYVRFASDGRYLGDVLFPEQVRDVAPGDRVAWGVIEDADGLQTVVRFDLP
jgi:hypothetical protein